MIVTLAHAHAARDREIGRLLDRIDEVLGRCDQILAALLPASGGERW